MLLGPRRKISSSTLVIHPIHENDSQNAKNIGELSGRHLLARISVRKPECDSIWREDYTLSLRKKEAEMRQLESERVKAYNKLKVSRSQNPF